MKKLKWYLRAAVLLPVATVIYLKKQGKAGWAVLIGVPVLCVLLIAGLAVRHHRAGGAVAAMAAATPAPAQAAEIQPTAAETPAEPAQASPPQESAPAETQAPSPSPTPVPEPVQITLTFAGDCTMGLDPNLGYSGSFNEMYDRQGPDYFLANVKDIFDADDLTVVNFEGTLTESTDRADKSFTFKGDKAYTAALTAASVEVADVANNHSHDYGDQGFADTLEALDAAGIVHFGYEDVAIVEVKGVKVGFTGQFTVYNDPQHLVDLQNNIQTLKDRGAELIVACFHWGLENDYGPEADQIELAHAAIDAGAHLVIGHHPHVMQRVEVYHGRYIAYSLGNFCFGGNYNPPDYDCMIFRQTFTVQGDQVAEDEDVEVIPCSVSSVSGYNNYQPTPAEGDARDRIWAKLRDLTGDLGEKNIFE